MAVTAAMTAFGTKLRRMRTEIDETVRGLVVRGDFDRAVDRYRQERAAQRAADARVNEMVQRLDDLRHRLRGQVDDEQRKIDELRRELEEINDQSAFNHLVRALFGDDVGAGDVGTQELDDRILLLAGLRADVLSHAVRILLRANDGGDDD